MINVPAGRREPRVRLQPPLPITRFTATGWTADIDIYGPTGCRGSAPNVVFLLDNTSNWSANNQTWNATDSRDQVQGLDSDRSQSATAISEDLFVD